MSQKCGNGTVVQSDVAAGGWQVVVIRGDGSADWEACANRGVDVPEGRGLMVTCHMGSGETHFYPAPEGSFRVVCLFSSTSEHLPFMYIRTPA